MQQLNAKISAALLRLAVREIKFVILLFFFCQYEKWETWCLAEVGVLFLKIHHVQKETPEVCVTVCWSAVQQWRSVCKEIPEWRVKKLAESCQTSIKTWKLGRDLISESVFWCSRYFLATIKNWSKIFQLNWIIKVVNTFNFLLKSSFVFCKTHFLFV